MSRMEVIIVEIDENGNVTLEAKGFKGKKCTDATRAFIEAMGTQVKEKKTEEYYQPDYQPTKKKVRVISQ